MLDVSKKGKHVTTLTTTRGFYPAQDASLGVIGRFFNGQADSNVGLDAGITHDIWTVINPDLTPLQPLINKGDKLFAADEANIMSKAASLPPAQTQQALNSLFAERDAAITGLTQRFVTHPWAVNFLMIVSPLVTWIWLGALIIALGGLIALWPVPALRTATGDVAGGRAPAPRTQPALPAREPVMDASSVQFVIVLAILAAVVVIVGMPIRRARIARSRGRSGRGRDGAGLDRRLRRVAELEAARDAKYREIRDAQLDHRTGKLSDSDFERRRRAASRGDRDPARGSSGRSADAAATIGAMYDASSTSSRSSSASS